MYVVLAMAGTTQKSCVDVFPLWSLKKIFSFCFLGGRGRWSNVNQQKHTQKIQSLNLIRSHISIMTIVTVYNYYLIDNKYKNNNNSNY